ncbi:MAG: ParB N-terminal domain-containing protein [Thermoplasmata archaeon]|nr:ParB N-terminal domain-containing protein [Thermoplasmata archaeon]
MTIDVGKVGMVPIGLIDVDEDRARELLGDLDSLEQNMKESGLITPLAMKSLPSGRFKLLAGERRFTVLSRNNIPEVPARIYDRDLTILEMKIIEKSENFFRKDMEFYEMDKLTLEIHRMQEQLHGTKSPGPGQAGWSMGDTGDMIGGVSKATISQAIKRAELREALPEVFEGCKTAADALKMIKKMDEAVVKQVIAKQVESKNENTGSALSILAKSYIIESCFEGIKKIPSGVFHLVEIDPPYAIKIMEQKKSEGESQYLKEDYNEVLADIYMDGDPNGSWKGMKYLFKECYRVMTEHSWLLVWFGPDPWFEQMYKEIKNAGFETTRMCPIWAKPSGQTKQPETKLPNAYEMFFYAWKGRPAIARQRGGNVFNYSPVPPQSKVHPTERPLEMMKDIYATFAFEGSRVLIPFVGSGSGLIAAHQLGMTGIGFELTKAYRDSFLVKANSL